MTRSDPAKRERDHYWWMHPAFRGEQTLELDDAGVMDDGAMLWVRHADGGDRADDAASLPADGGPYATLAKLLFKMNNYRPGPVTGWFVVVCVEAGRRWGVGQLRADAARPVQVFEDLLYDSEERARDKARALRTAEPGVTAP